MARKALRFAVKALAVAFGPVLAAVAVEAHVMLNEWAADRIGRFLARLERNGR